MDRKLTHIEQVLRAEALKSVDLGLPTRRIPLSDQQQILRTDIREILAGRTVIYDDHDKPQPR